MIGKRTEDVLNRAVRSAFERGHEYFTLEHVLLSLLDEEDVAETVRTCGGALEQMQRELEDYLKNEIPRTREGRSGAFDNTSKDSRAEHPVATLSIQRLIQRALFHVQSAGKEEIAPLDLFVAIFQAKDSFALTLMTRQGIERLDVLNTISHGPGEHPTSGSSGEREANSGAGASGPNGPATIRRASSAAKQADEVDSYLINLNQFATQGKIDPLVGRASEMERMIQVLCRRRKNNPLLVGEAGVGKTALAEGLALRVTKGEVPEDLHNIVVYSLDLGAMLAGAKFRGDFEQRFKKVLTVLQARREKGQRPVVLIDEIHTLIGAGSVSGGSLDAANLLKPVLSRGEIQCIGSTTYAEYRSTFEKDHALARRFQKIDIVEPTQEEAVRILEGLRIPLEVHHSVTYAPESLRAAVELSARHITDRHLPDKAIDVLDEAGARHRLMRAEGPVVPSDIEEVIAKMARIPSRNVTTNQKEKLKNLERDLRLAIFGQDSAIDQIVASIRLARSGLRSGDRPVGCFLFVGPTGVGKTELARQLGHCLGVPLLRFDMSEYAEKHTVSRLIGAPPGYVGFEQAGLLTEALLKNPHSVVLLDEFEKAHSDVWNILLQVMDHGVLTDQNGRKADFRNAILIMTSNLGSREVERQSMGIVRSEGGRTAAQREIERQLSPEFRNRLDTIVYFDALDPVTVGMVVGKQLVELESQLIARGVELEVSSDAREWLAQKGYDRQMGARPLGRLIEQKIKKPLAEEILHGRLEHGGRVKVEVFESELKFTIEAREPAPRPEPALTEAPKEVSSP